MKKKQTKTQRINAMLAARPELTIKEVAEKLGVTPNLVHQVRWKAKRNSEFVNKVFTKAGLKKPSRIIDAVTEMKSTLDALDKIKDRPKYRLASAFSDLVNHPAHYKAVASRLSTSSKPKT